ncbi:MAG: FG-GAP repeat protein [Xanthomonadales bacterium]|nr:FG-GAP repeat protein [Xanthomonadales bacterium]
MSSPRPTRITALATALACLTQATGAFAVGLAVERDQLLLLGSAQLPAPTGQTSAGPLAAGDFNCDGESDLAVGSPLSTITGIAGAGSVSMLFGEPMTGVASAGRLLHQDLGNIDGVAEADDRFGSSLTAADFDGDLCTDLAIGVPLEDIDSATNAGMVALLLGETGGLAASNIDLTLPGTGTAPNGTVADHAKGIAVAAVPRMTTASTRPFLAISATGHDHDALATNSGGVSVRRNASGILDGVASFFERSDLPGESDRYVGRFGDVLAAGDFDGDGFGDLVAYTQAVDGCFFNSGPDCIRNEGALFVNYGAASAANFRYEVLHQDVAGIAGAVELNDQFGEQMAVGDFNNDGLDDLAVGAISEDVGDLFNAGTVTVLYGHPGGLAANTASSDTIDENDFSGLLQEEGDEFGGGLAAGDFNRDGFDDLAIGVAGEDLVNGGVNVGSVIVASGSAAGIVLGTRTVVNLDSSGRSRSGDRYGATLASGDFNNDNVDDLAVGIPNRKDGSATIKGAVHLVFSTADTSTSIQSISPPQVMPGQTYSVTVRSRRIGVAATPLGRGTVNVQELGGGSCVATLNTVGDGSCSITAGTLGTRTVNASYPGVAGFRASNATAASVSVVGTGIFQNSFE